MEITERRSWAVAEFTAAEIRLIESDLSEEDATKIASQYNKVGDYSYAAVPIIITTGRGKPADLDSFFKRIQQRLG